ncbi:leucine--tRNA ligase [Glycomyces artemisiae]|uniref:Leucine--tRNA ligase n=1 Tax=Glycomyces artemisiae TaxID=1076443 RepID=A0A2T0UKB7_9ACTN|nr:leucine--tRNA ligase [Glycomyces artemisiae]PRY58389.1 leucyl-tRNA synthetase [Glycomyces artemisiae]
MTEPAHRYDAKLANAIEPRWQERWEAERTFRAPNPSGELAEPGHPRAGAPKKFVMDMFPYPSGAGLHVGHPLGYIATDAYSRYLRMAGYNVLHPLGFDAFGLPTEQYAIATGRQPAEITAENIGVFRRQLRRVGMGYDNRREFATTDPDYFKWTQWIFLQIFNSWYDTEAGKARPISELIAAFESGERTVGGRAWSELSDVERRRAVDEQRLAYVTEAPVNWCPGLGTVLSNEEVTSEGRSERGNFPVYTRTLKQWMMRITAYADRLLSDLDGLDWTESLKSMQRNWIGKSTGAYADFATYAGDIRVFTTRPDTLFGATYMVLAPEHPLVDALTAETWPADVPAAWTGGHDTPAGAVAAYRAQAAAKTDVERQADAKEKTGVFTGGYATNPVNGETVPVFIADYVLAGYGTGAIMAVPAHDARDFDFATAFGIPIVQVVSDGTEWDRQEVLSSTTGTIVNSGFLDGLSVPEAKDRVIAWLAEHGRGEKAVTFRLRDWLFSRQRYWGEPFPIVYDETGLPVALTEDHLPVELPQLDDFSPKTFDPEDADSAPEPPLGRAKDWVEVELDLGDGPKQYRREVNTMPNWAGSSWYELRYTDPKAAHALADPANESYWMGPADTEDVGGVDLYIGGVEHAVLHLLYARFWQKVLFDLGHVSSREPFRRLFNQGYIQAYAYTDERGVYVPAEEVEEQAEGVYTYKGEKVNREYGKMGKSLKNVVTPDEICESYGADTFRVYEMSMGPLADSKPWETRAIVGSQRFLQRLWRNIVDEETGETAVADVPASEETLREIHKAVAGVRDDYENLRMNTAVAKLITLNNHVTGLHPVPREAAEALVVMVAPVAPHIAEELWERLGHTGGIAYVDFPVADERYLVEDTVTYPVQINGKVRGRIEVAAGASEADVKAAALAEEKVAANLDGKDVKKVIVVAGKMVSIVAK